MVVNICLLQVCWDGWQKVTILSIEQNVQSQPNNRHLLQRQRDWGTSCPEGTAQPKHVILSTVMLRKPHSLWWHLMPPPAVLQRFVSSRNISTCCTSREFPNFGCFNYSVHACFEIFICKWMEMKLNSFCRAQKVFNFWHHRTSSKFARRARAILVESKVKMRYRCVCVDWNCEFTLVFPALVYFFAVLHSSFFAEMVPKSWCSNLLMTSIIERSWRQLSPLLGRCRKQPVSEFVSTSLPSRAIPLSTRVRKHFYDA